jgi:molybdate transport system substrate-binding protein
MRLAALALLVLLSGCAPQSSTVTVFAAASLADAFEQVAVAFEAENPGVEVRLSTAGSSTLAAQLAQGAPADVFAAASIEAMGEREAIVFATNRLVLVVAAGSTVNSLHDLSRPELTIALCAVEVPCGAAAAELLAAEGVVPSVDTFELDVRAVLTKIELGEVDAGLVYVTGVTPGITAIEVDAESVPYPIASLTAQGDAFVAFVLSEAGQRILREAGFGAP